MNDPFERIPGGGGVAESGTQKRARGLVPDTPGPSQEGIGYDLDLETFP